MFDGAVAGSVSDRAPGGLVGAEGMLLRWSWGGDRAEPYVVEKGPVRVRHDDAVACVIPATRQGQG